MSINASLNCLGACVVVAVGHGSARYQAKDRRRHRRYCEGVYLLEKLVVEASVGAARPCWLDRVVVGVAVVEVVVVA